MITTENVLSMLENNGYDYVARDSDGYLSAYKEKPEIRRGVYYGAGELNIDDFDGAFFQNYIGVEAMKELYDLIGENTSCCLKKKEDNDSDFIKFLKAEMSSIIELFERKSKAYGSNEDVFHNFRQSARRIYNDDSVNSMFMIAETLKDKHNVALSKGADVHECAERLRDNIVYSLIQLAMLKEKGCACE